MFRLWEFEAVDSLRAFVKRRILATLFFRHIVMQSGLTSRVTDQHFQAVEQVIPPQNCPRNCSSATMRAAMTGRVPT